MKFVLQVVQVVLAFVQPEVHHLQPVLRKAGVIVTTLSLLFNSSLPSEPAQGIVDRAIAYGQPGRVKYRGTYWSAQLYHPDRETVIAQGEPVRILAMRGITLLVVPAPSF
jgi:membrane-bound ClpP family serine protease